MSLRTGTNTNLRRWANDLDSSSSYSPGSKSRITLLPPRVVSTKGVPMHGARGVGGWCSLETSDGSHRKIPFQVQKVESEFWVEKPEHPSKQFLLGVLRMRF